MTCDDRETFLQQAYNQHEPRGEFAAKHPLQRITSGFHDQEIARLKKQLEGLVAEVLAWRDEHPDEQYHPKSGTITFNGVIQNCLDENPE